MNLGLLLAISGTDPIVNVFTDGYIFNPELSHQILYNGGEVVGLYDFYDVDNQSESSNYKWQTSSDKIVIGNVGGLKNYTPDSNDVGKYLRFAVNAGNGFVYSDWSDRVVSGTYYEGIHLQEIVRCDPREWQSLHTSTTPLPAQGLSSKTFTGDGYMTFKMPNTDDVLSIGFRNSSSGSQISYEIKRSGQAFCRAYADGVWTGDFADSFDEDSVLKLEIISGVVTAQVSNDGGDSFTTFHTYVAAALGDEWLSVAPDTPRPGSLISEIFLFGDNLANR